MLTEKLLWLMEEEVNFTYMYEKVLRTPNERERRAVYYSNDLLGYFVEVGGDAEMADLVEALGGPLGFKMRWVLAEGTDDELMARLLRQSPAAEIRTVFQLPHFLEGLRREAGRRGSCNCPESCKSSCFRETTVTTPISEEHWEKNRNTGQWSVLPFEGTGRYHLRYSTKELAVSVRIRFTGVPVSVDQKQLWRFGIKFKWNNHFAFRNSRRTIPVIFEPFFVVSGHDHTVNVSSPTDTNSRANAENWFTNTGADTAAHEFGHLLGLEDEYNLTLTRYVEVTGGKEPATQNQIGGYTLPNVMGPSSRLPVGRHMMPFLMHLNNMERGLAASAGRRPDFYKLTKQK